MSVEYSIGVSNRFAQLLSDDEADPMDVIRESEKEKEKDVKKLKGSNKQDVKSAKTGKEQAKTTATKRDNVNEEARKENRSENRRGGKTQRGDMVKKENERNTRNDEIGTGDDRRGNNRRRRENTGSTGDEGKEVSEARDGGDRFSGERGRGRGRGGRGRGGFPGRGGAGGGRGGKREFERRSGSDKSSVRQDDKRGGGGSYNWGSPTDQAEEGEGDKEQFSSPQRVDWAESSPDPNNVTSATADDSAEAEDGEGNLEDEVQEMSLEEYKKEQEIQRSKATFNIRKAGEGESKAQWKNTKVLAKPSDDDVEPLFAPKRIIEEKIKTSGRVLKHLDIDLKFQETERGGGDFRGGRRGRGRGGERGGRGRGRGGRGAGGRGGRTPTSNGPSDDDSKLNFDNPEEFPSLE